MTSINFNLPDTTLSALYKTPEEFTQEMRIAAAVKWYELERISQGKAAEIAGLTRAEFIQALSRYQVFPFQYTETELQREISEATLDSTRKSANDCPPSNSTAAALARIRSRPRRNPIHAGLPDSTALIREDRDR
jgi:predicted HTH domain antitoxin